MRCTSALLTKGSYPLQHSAQPGGHATLSGISLRCSRASSMTVAIAATNAGSSLYL